MYRVGSSIKKSNQIRLSCVNGATNTIRNYATNKSTKERYSEFVDFDEEDIVIDTRKVVETKEEVQEDVKDFDQMLASISLKDLKLMRYRENPEVYELFKKQHVDVNDAFNVKLTTKSLFEKERLKREQELKGSQFKTQKVSYDKISHIKSQYIASELNKFKEQYEKPLVKMYNEITNQQNLLFKTQRAEERLRLKKLEKQRKQYKLSSLERHYRDVVQVRNALDFRGKTILAGKDEEDAWQRIVERTEISDPHNLSRTIMADEYNDLGYQSEINEEYINMLSINPFDFANPNSYSSMVKFLDSLAEEEEEGVENTTTQDAAQIEQFLVQEQEHRDALVENYEFYRQMNRPSVANTSSIDQLVKNAKTSLAAGSAPLTEEQIIDLLPFDEEVEEDRTEDPAGPLVDEFEGQYGEEYDEADRLFRQEEEEYDEQEEEEEQLTQEEKPQGEGEQENQLSTQEQPQVEGEQKPVENVEGEQQQDKDQDHVIIKEQTPQTAQKIEELEELLEEEDPSEIEVPDEDVDEELKNLRELVKEVEVSGDVEVPAEKLAFNGHFGLEKKGLEFEEEDETTLIKEAIKHERLEEEEFRANYMLPYRDRDNYDDEREKIYNPMPNNLPDLEALSAKIRKSEEAELSAIADRFIDKEVNEKTAHDLVDQIFDSYKVNNLFNPDVIEHDKNVIREANGDVAVPDSMYFEYDTTFRDLVDRDVVFKMPLKDTDLVRVLTHQLTESGILKQEKVLKYSPEVMPVSKEMVDELPDRFPNFVKEVLNQKSPSIQSTNSSEYSEESSEDATTTSESLSSSSSAATTTTTTTTSSKSNKQEVEQQEEENNGENNEIYDERRLYINLKPAVKDEGVITIPTVNKKLRWKFELDEAESNDKWLMGKPFDMLSYRMNGQETTISPVEVQINKVYDEEMDEEAPLIEELVDDEDDDYRDLSPGCDQEPDLFEETELFHYLQEGGDQEWFRPEKIGEADIKALEARQTWVPNQRQHIYTYPIQFVSSSNTTDQTQHDTWINRKAIMRVNIQAFNLPECVEQRLADLTGKRYDSKKKVLTLVASGHKTLNENKYEVKRIFKELLHEANLADPNFVPVRPDNYKPSPPPSFSPSVAAKAQEKFNLYRIQGFPILTNQQKKQLELSSFIKSQLE